MPERDTHGRFVKANITAKTEVKTPIPTTNPEFEKPVLSVTVNNPIKKILYWLDQIRKHQTTTFAVKLSIPLIALPVLVFAAFQLGRGSVVLPFLNFTSVSPTPLVKPSTSPSPGVPYSRSGTLKIARTGNLAKYVLALKNGENVLLDIPINMDLAKYQNKLVLITGIFERQSNLIKVTEIAEIEVINETNAPSPSPVPTPPQSTSSAQ